MGKANAVTKKLSPYETLVADATSLLRAMQGAVLETYHGLGEKVGLLMENRAATYGKKVVDDFARSLQENGQDINASSLYNARALNKHLSPKQLAFACEKGISMHRIMPLCADRVSAELRDEMLDMIAKEQLSRERITATLNERIQGPEAADSSKKTDKTTKSDSKPAKSGDEYSASIERLKAVETVLIQLAEKDMNIEGCVRHLVRSSNEDYIQAGIDLYEAIESARDELILVLDKSLMTVKSAVEEAAELMAAPNNKK